MSEADHASRPPYMKSMSDRFLQIVHERMGDRHNIGLSDELAFRMVTDVVILGLTHKEAAQGLCSPGALARRHQEYAESQVMSQFMIEFGTLHLYFLHGGERPEWLPDDTRSGDGSHV